jgi:colanic acid/amylovoran biosynthesis protein
MAAGSAHIAMTATHIPSAGDRPSRVTILIIHAFSPKNLGDGAIILAMIAEARRVFGDDVQISISATEPDAFEAILGIPAHGRLLPQRSIGRRGDRIRWLIRNLPAIALLWLGSTGGRARLERLSRSRLLGISTRTALSAYLSADIVVAAGGGYLGDPYRRPLPFWHLEYRCARAADRPLVFFSQSVGSVRHFSTRLFVRKAIQQSRLFIARDPQTLVNIASLGSFDDKTVLCADVALLLEAPREVRSGPGSAGPCIGVSLIRWDHYSTDNERQHESYLEAVREALTRLLLEDPTLRLRFYGTNEAHRTNPMNDRAVLDEMKRRLAGAGFGDRCTVIDWTADPGRFMGDVAQCDLFVATRMHSSILALNAGVPVAAIAYEEKTRGMLGMFGLGAYVADIENPAAITAMVSRAFEDRLEMRGTVDRIGPEVRARASRAMELVAEVAAGRYSPGHK